MGDIAIDIILISKSINIYFQNPIFRYNISRHLNWLYNAKLHTLNHMYVGGKSINLLKKLQSYRKVSISVNFSQYRIVSF